MSTKKSTVVRFSRVKLAALLVGSTQSRVKIDPSVVSEYAEAMKRGIKFPPLIVYKNRDGQFRLADGFHRASAAIEAGLSGFDVEVRQGTEWDALLYSVGANGAHGLRPTNADKRNAATMLLNHPESRKWSNNKIALHCQVSGAFVGEVRRELTVDDPEIAATERQYERNGKVGTQKTGKIGKTKATKKKPADNRVKEVVVTEKDESSDRPVSQPVVPAAVSESVTHSEQDRVTTNVPLTNAMLAQVSVAENSASTAPATDTASSKPADESTTDEEKSANLILGEQLDFLFDSENEEVEHPVRLEFEFEGHRAEKNKKFIWSFFKKLGGRVRASNSISATLNDTESFGQARNEQIEMV